jgi:hypothetical protein
MLGIQIKISTKSYDIYLKFSISNNVTILLCLLPQLWGLNSSSHGKNLIFCERMILIFRKEKNARARITNDKLKWLKSKIILVYKRIHKN